MKKIVLFILGTCIVVPLMFLLLWSVLDKLQWPDILPKQLSLDTWRSMLLQKQFIDSIAVSLGVSAAATLLAMTVSLPAAFAISQYAFKGRAIVWVLLLMPLIIPSVSISIGLHIVFLKCGLTDTFAGVVLCHLIPTVPYAVKILTSNFELLGRGLGDQARILGASTWDVIMKVYLPNMKPAVSLSAMLVFVVSFSQYLLTFLIGGGMIKTLPILLFPVMQSGDRSEVSVYSMVFILTAMAATYLIEKYLGENNRNDYYINVKVDSMHYLEVEAIEKSYGSKKILDKVSFRVKKGEFLSILGESGCGKTTLLKIITGLVKQDGGKLLLEQHNISDVPTQKRGIAMVFQDYLLFPHLNARDNVEFSLKMKGIEEKKRRAFALEYLELVQLGGLSGKYPHELSGGQKQRVAIARALVAEPKAILLDEPFSNLDTNLRSEMCEFIKRLQKQIEMTAIMVTHDRKEAMQLSDNILLLHNGNAVQYGTPEEVYRTPANMFAARFMGDLNLIEGQRRQGRFYSTLGLEFPDEGMEQEVTYAVRPEAVTISAGEKGGCIKGIIQSRAFLGEKISYTVAVNGKSLSVIALGGGREYAVGQEVYLDIPFEGIIKTTY